MHNEHVYHVGASDVLVHNNSLKAIIEVDPRQLKATANTLDDNIVQVRPKYFEQIIKHPSSDTADPIHLIRLPDGTYGVLNGRTRAVRAILEGKTSIRAIVIQEGRIGKGLPTIKEIADGLF